MKDHKITARDLKNARKAYQQNAPRDLFYRAATAIVDLALRGVPNLTLAEALAVLLQTWNKAHYQYRKFDNRHFASIDRLLSTNKSALAKYRDQDICHLDDEKKPVTALFRAFEKVLGPVGAAKALHLLAPNLFPIWDRKIAEAYKLALGKAGSNGGRYWRFILISKTQCERISKDGACPNPLKSIDEYNYCKYTKNWIK